MYGFPTPEAAWNRVASLLVRLALKKVISKALVRQPERARQPVRRNAADRLSHRRKPDRDVLAGGVINGSTQTSHELEPVEHPLTARTGLSERSDSKRTVRFALGLCC